MNMDYRIGWIGGARWDKTHIRDVQYKGLTYCDICGEQKELKFAYSGRSGCFGYYWVVCSDCHEEIQRWHVAYVEREERLEFRRTIGSSLKSYKNHMREFMSKINLYAR